MPNGLMQANVTYLNDVSQERSREVILLGILIGIVLYHILFSYGQIQGQQHSVLLSPCLSYD